MAFPKGRGSLERGDSKYNEGGGSGAAGGIRGPGDWSPDFFFL